MSTLPRPASLVRLTQTAGDHTHWARGNEVSSAFSSSISPKCVSVEDRQAQVLRPAGVQVPPAVCGPHAFHPTVPRLPPSPQLALQPAGLLGSLRGATPRTGLRTPAPELPEPRQGLGSACPLLPPSDGRAGPTLAGAGRSGEPPGSCGQATPRR